MTVQRLQLLCIPVLSTLIAVAGGVTGQCADQPAPLQVYILAGQSNMEGKGWASHIENQKDDPALAEDFSGLKRDGKWVVRDDVWIAYPTNAMRGGPKKGKLAVGFGTKKHDDVGDEIGPEFSFGHTVGNATEAPVLLIKTAWGGKNVKKDFLPPGEGGPGEYYTKMVDHVAEVLSNLEETVPGYEGQGYEIAGFVWFQGFNDMVDRSQREEKYANYTKRLATLIRDLRKEWKSPQLPVVIGECGTGGPDNRGDFQKAQAAVADIPEFKGTVKFVTTANHYDMKAHALYLQGVWKDPEQRHRFYDVASDRPYHYLGSGKTYYLIGRSLATAMLELKSAAAKPSGE